MSRARTKAEDVPFERLRTSFAVHNQTTGKSRNTIRFYEYRLELFQRFVGPWASLGDFMLDNARAYIADLQNRDVRYANTRYNRQTGPLSSSYIQGFARALRAFSTWLHAGGYTRTNVLRPMGRHASNRR